MELTQENAGSSLDCLVELQKGDFRFSFWDGSPVFTQDPKTWIQEGNLWHSARFPSTNKRIDDVFLCISSFQFQRQNLYQTCLSKNPILIVQKQRYGCKLLDPSMQSHNPAVQLLQSSPNPILDHLAIERSTPY